MSSRRKRRMGLKEKRQRQLGFIKNKLGVGMCGAPRQL